MDRDPSKPFAYSYQQPYQQAYQQAQPQYQQPQQPQYQQQAQPMMGISMMSQTQQPIFQQQQPQQQHYLQSVQQAMQQQHNIQQQYIQNPIFSNSYYKPMMQQQQMFQQMPQYQQYGQPMMFQQQQPKKKFNPYDYEEDEEIVEEEPSSEEAEFTYSTDESEEEEFTQEMYEGTQPAPNLPAVRRTAGREHRAERKFSSDETEVDEEEEFYETKRPTVEETKIEHIFVSRIRNQELEYLVRFQDAKDCLCQWEPESLLLCLDNATSHLSRFEANPIDITGDNGKDIVPIAFRKNDSTNELLFRFTFDQTVLLYWDEVNDEALHKFLDSRHRVVIADPEMPIGDLPEPTSNIINKESGSVLREYQLSGLKWLIQCWRDRHGSVLADEMGLGKTIQVLAFLTYLNKYTDFHGPYMITVRTNTFKQWCDEIEKWTDLSYIPYSSGPQQRKIIREYQFPYIDDNGNRDIDAEEKPRSLSFNILLVSYDVLLKDIEFLSSMKWQCLVVDEGHRIKNSEGKKNNAMKSLNTLHRIILTGTPVQNTLQELWTLLNFVSPDDFEENPEFLQGDIESLDQEKLSELKKKIHPHLLRRTLAEAERTIAPKEEKIALVSLTNVQRELIRLIQLHSMWRLKGVQVNEDTVDTSHESASIQKVCCHPFLIEGAESYYTEHLHLDRIDLLRNLSSKFIWISKILEDLKRENHKVLIFSQKVQLLRLLREFCILSGYNTELLIGEMNDIEKSDAIERYSNNPESFVFLISTRAGSEGLNLTVADTAIIFDPDWNPQNDLQAQARVHRIGQKQKVDVIRLITYQTYEHEMFVRAQKKLGLWMDLLGENNSAEASPVDRTPVAEPPQLSNDMEINSSMPLLPQLSTVVNEFSMSALPSLEATLETEPDYTDGVPEEEFLARFPVVADDFTTRRVKRSRSYDNIDNARAREIMEELRFIGYGKWDLLAERFKDHSTFQLENFTLSLIILCFRALPPMELTRFPFLLKLLEQDVPDFSLDMIICTKKGKWLHAVREEHEFYIEVQACKPLKDTIYDNAYDFLMGMEVKLIAKNWLQFNSVESLDFNRVAPPYTKRDQECLEAICSERADLDQYDERVNAIATVMKEDLIKSGRTFAAMQIDFWSGPELDTILNMMKNFTFSVDDPLDLHVKTGLLSKRQDQIVEFVRNIKVLIDRKVKRFPIDIRTNIAHFDRAPEELQTCKSAIASIQIQKREYLELSERIDILRSLKIREERIQPFPETTTWSNYHTKRLFQYLLQFGLDSWQAILLDKKIGLVRVLTKVDRRYVQKKLKTRIREQNSAPDFVLSLEELCSFLRQPTCEDYFEKARTMQYTYLQPGQVLDTYESSSDDSEIVQLPDDEPIIEPTTTSSHMIQQPIQTIQTMQPQIQQMQSFMGQPQQIMQPPMFYSNLMMNSMTMQPQQLLRKQKRNDDDYGLDGSLLDDD